MKPYPVLQALLLLGTTSVYGQIDLSVMDTLSTDSLQKSEIRYFSPGKGGVNRVWNFSQKLGSKVSSQVMFVKDSTGVISIIEPGRNRYYHSTAADFQPYKYNGKELDKMHGLNTYDYGARQHGPILARWDRIDPLCEKYYSVSPYVYCTNNPIKLLDQQGKEPTPYEAALMAKHVYGDKVNLAGGWHLSKTQYKSFNTESGLQSALYERTAKGVKEYAYVTAGTQDITDAKEDINQLFGVGTQYRESVNNAKILSNNLVNSELTFVGHSLGGGLAAANALATDRNAITINAAAISKSTKDNLQLPSSTSKGRIFNIVVKGEIVGYLQTKLGMKLEGGAYTLNAIYLPGNSIINTVLRINNHLIDTVIRKLEGERK